MGSDSAAEGSEGSLSGLDPGEAGRARAPLNAFPEENRGHQARKLSAFNKWGSGRGGRECPRPEQNPLAPPARALSWARPPLLRRERRAGRFLARAACRERGAAAAASIPRRGRLAPPQGPARAGQLRAKASAARAAHARWAGACAVAEGDAERSPALGNARRFPCRPGRHFLSAPRARLLSRRPRSVLLGDGRVSAHRGASVLPVGAGTCAGAERSLAGGGRLRGCGER